MAARAAKALTVLARAARTQPATIDLLERACATRAAPIAHVRGSFLFAPLREHPRFQALLRRLNL